MNFTKQQGGLRSFNNASCCLLPFVVVVELEEKQGINGKHMQCDVIVIHVKWGEINVYRNLRVYEEF